MSWSPADVIQLILSLIGAITAIFMSIKWGIQFKNNLVIKSMDKQKAEIEKEQNFQEEIVNKIIDQYTEQNVRYVENSNKLRDFMFDKIEKVSIELHDTNKDSKKIHAQLDILERRIKEFERDSIKRQQESEERLIIVMKDVLIELVKDK